MYRSIILQPPPLLRMPLISELLPLFKLILILVTDLILCLKTCKFKLSWDTLISGKNIWTGKINQNSGSCLHGRARWAQRRMSGRQSADRGGTCEHSQPLLWRKLLNFIFSYVYILFKTRVSLSWFLVVFSCLSYSWFGFFSFCWLSLVLIPAFYSSLTLHSQTWGKLVPLSLLRAPRTIAPKIISSPLRGLYIPFPF